MVTEQLEARGIRESGVLDAFLKIPRERFVRDADQYAAYQDRPLAVGFDQTISQPYMVGLMTQALGLRGGEKVLEIGTGTGYQTAILASLGAKVCTIERIERLSSAARGRLDPLGLSAHFHVGDGTLGALDEAPFDCIIVTAAAPSLPVALTAQLREDGGRMVIPVGESAVQDLLLVRREGGAVKRSRLCTCAFVKLIGREGWPDDASAA